MAWYVLQVLTGQERNVCEALRRKGVKARVPAQHIEIRRQGQWKSEERLLLPCSAAGSVQCTRAGTAWYYGCAFERTQPGGFQLLYLTRAPKRRWERVSDDSIQPVYVGKQ